MRILNPFHQSALIMYLAMLSAVAAVVPTNAILSAQPAMQIVTCRDNVDTDALLKEFHIKPKHHYRALKGFATPMDTAMIRKLKADPRVLFVEADGPVTLCDAPIQYGIRRMGMAQFPPARFNRTNEPLNVDVAILDSGIDLHEDMDAPVVDYYTFGTDGRDSTGHGTAVAGVVAARDNLVGVVGAAPGVRIWNIKVIGPPPNNGWSHILSGMSFVYQQSNKISVANISITSTWGSTAPILSLRAAVRRLVNAGIVVVAAAGNYNRDLAGQDGIYGTPDDVLPAALPEVMAVSAMDSTIDIETGLSRDTLWVETNGLVGSNFSQIERTNKPTDGSGTGWTNYVFSSGGAIDVAAPGGVNILTTGAGGSGNLYALLGGTSAAAPHVAGLVALYIAVNGRATNAAGVYKIRQAIIDNGLPQSQWNTNNTHDPDTNPEPLAIASENWVPKPIITNAVGASGNFQLGFATVPGYDYTVQSATNLNPPVTWTNLATVTGSSNAAPVSIIDTNIAAQSFYRIARQSLLGRLQLITNPRSRTNVVGTTASMNVAVFGEAPAYRWQKDGAPLTDGGKVSGAGTPVLTLTGVQSSDAGSYAVIITNVFGSVTSAVATLTIQSVVMVTGVLATATSEIASYGRYASNAVNGVYYDGNFWESVGVNSAWGNDPSPAITFDLGAVRLVDKAQIWNGHEVGPSVKRMRVETSTDGASFSPLSEFTLTTISPASETIPLGQVICRYVRFAILENGAGQIFPVVGPPTAGTEVAIDEVEFHEYLPD